MPDDGRPNPAVEPAPAGNHADGHIDLHAHTTASDGKYSPAALVGLAREIGLKALGVTDHDTLEGVEEALAQGARVGVEVVPGIEISAQFSGTMHILGYDLDHRDPGLQNVLSRLQEARRRRNPMIVEKLQKLGLDISMAEIEREAGGGQVGRPHFARVLCRKGFTATVDEAFDRYLKRGMPAYVEKFRLEPKEALAAIRRAGGLPVLAHPYSLRMDDLLQLEALLKGMIEAGLAGLEVYYPEHSPEMTRRYEGLARKLGLAPTGGSDFHEDGKNGVELGAGRNGNLRIPYRVLSDLRRKGEQKK